MSRTRMLSMVVVAAIIGGVAFAAEEAKEDLIKKAKCPVSGKAVNPEASAEYLKGKVYFCCEGCPSAFAKDKEKFATKANMQLVATKQVKQKACPLSGQATDDEAFSKVAGVKVNYCCGNCQKKVEGAEDDAQLELVFSNKAFKKAFEFPKKDGKAEKAEKEDAAS